MPVDDEYIRAVIASNREAERAAVEEAKQFTQWSDADVAAALDPDNPEVRRLTSPPTGDPEVERLARLLGDILHP